MNLTTAYPLCVTTSDQTIARLPQYSWSPWSSAFVPLGLIKDFRAFPPRGGSQPSLPLKRSILPTSAPRNSIFFMAVAIRVCRLRSPRPHSHQCERVLKPFPLETPPSLCTPPKLCTLVRPSSRTPPNCVDVFPELETNLTIRVCVFFLIARKI